ncbi:MAG: DEAD/DEAH box helicase [Proteobacteria bacterium]|nr:DEAD/DEAH box helicase [Pseudomonadota bacterium]
MKVHGVFVGIDRYASPAINWLSCAKRDATALHAIFADNLPGDLILLSDKEATLSNIEKELERLAKCNPDDAVFFAFSGHGTETHELVTYDTDTTKLSATTISLAKLAESFAKIPAQKLVCILDCCFSGGMGAKALQVDNVSRSMISAEELLKQLSGDGRIIFTASSATEKAWEHQKLGHGLLTNYLLEALQGAEEVRKDGKIGLYKLLDYVTTKVMDSAKIFGEEQHPMLLGQIKEEIMLPIFKLGEIYKTAFPERNIQKALPDINSLSAFGFPGDLLKAWINFSITTLNQLQLDAINEFKILDGEHLVVSAPTSSGKTMIGELAALHGVTKRKRALFLLPLKALVNDKLRHFEETYGSFGIRTIKATGESSSDDIVPLMRGQYDICLMTYEKFSAIVFGSPHVLDQIGTIVVDEVQMIADKNRGVNLEFIMTLLRMRRKQGIEPQLIALSAVIGDTNGFERWLGARLLRRTERPVPLDEGIIRLDGSCRYIESDTKEEKNIQLVRTVHMKGTGQDVIIPLTKKLVQDGKSVIVFRQTRSEAQSCALYLARDLGLPAAQTAIDNLPNADPSISSQKLRAALSGGVAFHISDLDAEERMVIEEQFRSSSSGLKVIAATTTLAMGVNTPTETVIISGLMHPGDQPYSVAEYKNITGRAGRLGYATRGASFVVALTPHEEHMLWSNYVMANPEDLQSKFFADNTDPRSLVIRVLVAARLKRGLSAREIVEFLEESFGSFQEKIKNPTWNWSEDHIVGVIEQLLQHGLIEQDGEAFYHLTKLGRLAGESSLEVESVLRVVNALQGVPQSEITDTTLIALSQITVELDQVLFPMNKRSTQKEPQVWMAEVRNRNQGISQSIINAFSRFIKDQSDVTLRAKKTVACLLWVSEMQLAEIERILMQFDRGDSAAGAIRSVSARVCDVLSTAAKIAAFLNPGLDLSNRVERLLIRLELGIPATGVNLGKIFGRIFNRGDYLRLVKNNITTREEFEAANESIILECLEGSTEKLLAAKSRLMEYAVEEKFIYHSPIVPIYQA